MLKILIVDDEIILRKGLTKAISKHNDFVIAGEAADGVEALSMLEQHSPDVVITDIRMPNMDGKELVRVITEKFPTVRKIVLSGFDDFGYVRDTMKNGAVDYLLKPVDDEKLIQLLKHLSEAIDTEKRDKEERIDQNIKLNESLPILKDRFLETFITGNNPNITTEELLAKFDYYGITIDVEDRFSAIFISIDNYRQFCYQQGEEEGKIKYFIVRNISEELIREKVECFSCLTEQGLVIFIKTSCREVLSHMVNSIFYNLNKYAQIRFSIVLSRSNDRLENLSVLYKEVCHDLMLRYYADTGTIIGNSREVSFSDWDIETEAIKVEFEKRLERIIESSNISEVKSAIEQIFDQLRNKNTHPGDVNQITADMFAKMRFKFNDFERAIDRLNSGGVNYLKEMQLIDTFDEIKKLSVFVYTELIKQIIIIRGKKDKKIIEIVKDYISKHYNEDITLAKITELVFVNANYFSEMFKNNTGENFIDYLTRFRIDKAKVLLKDVAIKTYEVGRLVGYDDPNYFSKVFKKVVGITPSQYRNIVL
ncbi:MAG: response regulator [Eubacterium sp.]|nr:response regulator [Eubacterium sp.]